MTLSFMVMESDGSNSFMAKKIFRCFSGKLTEFSDSEILNSTVIGCYSCC